MHNWHLLLFAFLAVLQPIVSFSERNLIDGRDQCSNRNSVLQDPAYGTRSTKLLEDRHISREIREDRRNEVRRVNSASIASSERRFVEFRSERDFRRISPEPTRFVRAEIRRDHVADNRRERLSALRDNRERRVRDTHRISSRDISRDLRERDATRMRYSREDIRQQNRDPQEAMLARTSRGDSRFTRNLDAADRIRASVEPRRETRRSRDNSAQRKVEEARETRDVLQRTRVNVARDEANRVRQERRVSRERTEERRARSESRIQLDSNRERRSLERRVRDTDEDRSTDRTRNFREISQQNHEAQNERSVNSRREASKRLDEKRMQRGERRDFRERTEASRRDIRDSDRVRTDFRNNRLERSDSRRHARSMERHVSMRDERASSENRLAKSRTLERETLHRDTERREYRSTDRIATRDNRNDIRLKSFMAREREGSPNREYRLAKLMERDTQLRTNPQISRSRENVDSFRKTTDEQANISNWQYIIYTLQGIYLCSILTKILTKESDKKPRISSWLSAPRSLLKVD